tara:strand:- start:767 stop:1270 length:504 start_codon:yes stop_codon:yes gene_type:complete
MTALKRSQISVRPSSIHGWGVFADQDFLPGDLIEQCYMLIFDGYSNKLSYYAFHTANTNQSGEVGLPLGCGSIYNHSTVPNAIYELEQDEPIVNFTATSAIKAGEEIFVSYGDSWFSDRKIKPAQVSSWHYIKRFLIRHKRMILITLAIALFINLTHDLSVSNSYTL